MRPRSSIRVARLSDAGWKHDPAARGGWKLGHDGPDLTIISLRLAGGIAFREYPVQRRACPLLRMDYYCAHVMLHVPACPSVYDMPTSPLQDLIMSASCNCP